MANAITGIRIVCAPILIFCPTFSMWFYILYVVCGISDVLDGIVARHLGTETKFGAQLDTIADTAFIVITIIKTVRAIYIPQWLIIWIICVAVVKLINLLSGLIIYKEFVPEHTVMNKICGVLLFAIPLFIGMLPFKTAMILIIFTCGVATFAAVQEGYYIRVGKIIR